jgi:hypothetical protein
MGEQQAKLATSLAPSLDFVRQNEPGTQMIKGGQYV